MRFRVLNSYKLCCCTSSWFIKLSLDINQLTLMVQQIWIHIWIRTDVVRKIRMRWKRILAGCITALDEGWWWKQNLRLPFSFNKWEIRTLNLGPIFYIKQKSIKAALIFHVEYFYPLEEWFILCHIFAFDFMHFFVEPALDLVCLSLQPFQCFQPTFHRLGQPVKHAHTIY